MAARIDLLEVIKRLKPDQKEFEEAVSRVHSRKLLKAMLEKTLNSGIVLEGVSINQDSESLVYRVEVEEVEDVVEEIM